jgi:hypothetical protein
MKKIIIPIIAFTTMTLTGVSQSNWKMNEAVNTLADMEEWISEDVANNRISEELGEDYLININQILKLILTSHTEDACDRDNDIDAEYFAQKEKREFTLIKFVLASNDSL